MLCIKLVNYYDKLLRCTVSKTSKQDEVRDHWLVMNTAMTVFSDDEDSAYRRNAGLLFLSKY